MPSYTPIPSTLQPAEVAVAMVDAAVVKHRTRLDKVFFKAVRCVTRTADWNAHCRSRIQFLAGVMLSFGGLLSELIQGGSPGLTASNPGLVKVMGGFVFPVGLVMYVMSYPLCCVLTARDRIVLQGQELLTSNMMVSASLSLSRSDQ